MALSAFLLLVAAIHFELTRRMILDSAEDDPSHVWSERLLVGMVIGLLGAVFVILAGLL